MNWKSFILGVSIGLIGGYAVKEAISQKGKVSPERVLEHVKSEFKKEAAFNISGSWIHMEAEPYEKGRIHYQVYKGGISTNEDGTSKQYEFIVDAATGSILEVYPLAG